jgi:WS/DGAT/MGAT family acyltransferase
MKQLGPQDAQFLYADTENTFANVAMVLVYGPPVEGRTRLDIETLIDHVSSRLHTSPIFRRRLKRVPLDLDYPYWIDDEFFDVNFHVQYSCLPQPGSWIQFTRFVSKYTSKPLDMNRPLWEICMVDGLDGIEDVPRGSFALIVKAHHAAIDGVSGMQFFAGLADKDENGTPAVDMAAAESQSVGDAPGPRQMFTRAMARNLRSPFRLLGSVRRAIPGALPAMVGKLNLRSKGEPKFSVPPTRFNAPVTPMKQFDACRFPLHDVKQMKSTVEGATVNDVVLAVCGGALRRYLQTHEELPQSSLIAWVPINARPKSGAEQMGGNQVTAMTVPLYTDLDKPHERLAAVTKYTKKSKEAKSGMSAKLMIEMSQHVPAYTMALVTRLILKVSESMRLCNLMVTNVPGPQVPVYLRGSKCLWQIGLTPIGDGMGLCIGTPSYNGEMAFTVISTPEMIPDIEFFMQCIKASFADLKKACAQAGKPAGEAAPRSVARRRSRAR